MKKKSNNPAPIPRLKAFVCVPVPPEVARWQRPGTGQEPFRQVTQERARDITGKSAHVVRRWANGHQPIDVTSLRLLQVWVWGIIPAPEFIESGVFLAHNQRWHPSFDGHRLQTLIATDNGYLISAADLQSFGWLKGFYDAKVREWERQNQPLPALSAQIIPFADYLRERRVPPAPAASNDEKA